MPEASPVSNFKMPKPNEHHIKIVKLLTWVAQDSVGGSFAVMQPQHIFFYYLKYFFFKLFICGKPFFISYEKYYYFQ